MYRFSVAGEKGTIHCRIPGEKMERRAAGWKASPVCWAEEGGCRPPRRAEGQRHEAVGDTEEPVREQSEEVERSRFLIALTSGLLWDVLEDLSGHNFNYVSCKLFSHLALTALNRAWLSR